MNAPFFERDIAEQFTEAVNQIPGAHIDATSWGLGGVPHLDAMADLKLHGHDYLLLIETKKAIFPGNIRDAIWQLKRYRDLNTPSASTLLVMLAETISPGARKELQAENIGYYDSSGSLFLPTPNAYIFVDREPTKKQAKIIGSVFGGRRPEVIEALWEAGQTWRNVKGVAERIFAAPSFVSATYQALEQHDWLDVQGSGPAKVRRLKNWDKLLDAWTEHERRREPLLFGKFYIPAKPQQIAQALNRACEEAELACELTGEMAANAYASAFSATSVVRCRMLPKRAGDQVLEQIGAKPVGEGWNLAVISAGPTDFWFKQERDGIMYASPLRTYLDLQRIGGRGKDGAQLLREQRLTLS